VNNTQGFEDGRVYEIVGQVSSDGTTITQLQDTQEVCFYEEKNNSFGMLNIRSSNLTNLQIWKATMKW
jgi:hypothetical protein